jgi:hypothetical protein
MHGLCFVCASNCTDSFVYCKECGLTFHSECLGNEQLLGKVKSIPDLIKYQLINSILTLKRKVQFAFRAAV